MMLMSVESTMSLWIGIAFTAAVVIGFVVYAWLTARHQRAAKPPIDSHDEREVVEPAEHRAA